MSDNRYELNELQGSLWHESNCTVVRKGKIKIDGVDRYVSIIKYTSPTGDEKFELSISAGLLRINPEESKLNTKSPDIYGAVTFNNRAYKFGGWRNITEKGTEWTGVRLSVKEDESQADEYNENSAPF